MVSCYQGLKPKKIGVGQWVLTAKIERGIKSRKIVGRDMYVEDTKTTNIKRFKNKSQAQKYIKKIKCK